MQKLSEIYYKRKPDEIYFRSIKSDLCIRTFSLVMSQSLHRNDNLLLCSAADFSNSSNKYTFIRSNARRLISAYNKKILFRNGSLGKLFLLYSSGLQAVASFDEYLRVLIFRKENGLFIDRHFRAIPPFDGNGKCLDIDHISESDLCYQPELKEIFSIKSRSSQELARHNEIFKLIDCDKNLLTNLDKYLSLR